MRRWLGEPLRRPHWHVWLAAEPTARQPVSMLRRVAWPFTSHQSARRWARRVEPDVNRVIVRKCNDEKCRHGFGR